MDNKEAVDPKEVERNPITYLKVAHLLQRIKELEERIQALELVLGGRGTYVPYVNPTTVTGTGTWPVQYPYTSTTDNQIYTTQRYPWSSVTTDTVVIKGDDKG